MSSPPADRPVALIFSKDRAMQLCAVIESLAARCLDADAMDIIVIYKASDEWHANQYATLAGTLRHISFVAETDFKSQVLDVTKGCKHILFLVDDNIFVMDFRIAEVVEALANNPDSVGFSLRLGQNTHRCFNHDVDMTAPDFERVGEKLLKYDWTNQPYDFGYPLEISSSVYRTGEIAPLLEQLDFANPNTLEGLMAANRHIYAEPRPTLLCFDYSVTFCNPVNMVQSVCMNRTGKNQNYSAENLADMFARGLRIDIAQYNGLITSGCHQDVELLFRQDAKPPSALSPKPSPNAPAVTIEMTAYNAAQFIGKAVESVLSQTFGDFELIIVDDGSTDQTGDILTSYNDERIKYIRQEHRNCASARNRIIAESRGEYLLCVDSDDFLHADYLEHMLKSARNFTRVDYFYPAQLVLVDGQGNPTGAVWKYHDFSDNRILPSCLFEHGASLIPNPGSLKRRSMFERTGKYALLDTVEDFAFLCKNALKISFMRVETPSAYFYRSLETGLSRRSETRDRISADILNEMISIFPDQAICPQLAGVSNLTIRRKLYYKYLAETFYKHASGYHMVTCGRYFQRYGDFYRTQMSKLSIGDDVLQTI